MIAASWIAGGVCPASASVVGVERWNFDGGAKYFEGLHGPASRPPPPNLKLRLCYALPLKAWTRLVSPSKEMDVWQQSIKFGLFQ